MGEPVAAAHRLEFFVECFWEMKWGMPAYGYCSFDIFVVKTVVNLFLFSDLGSQGPLAVD